MASWAEQKLQGSTQPPKKLSWAEQKILSMKDTSRMASPVHEVKSPAEDEGAELNPFFTFGKKTVSTVWNQMLPSMAVSLQVAIQEGLQASEWAAEQTVGRIPGVKALDRKVAEVTGIPKMSELQRKYLLEDAVSAANTRKAADAEYTKGLIQSWDQVKDPLTGLNWAVGSLAQLAPQIVASLYTAGASGIGQEVGSIYLEQLDAIAKENGITPIEVVQRDLDEPAVALMAGGVAGTLEFLGAKGVAGQFKSEALRKFMSSPAGKVFRNKMAQFVGKTTTSAAGEVVTEMAQTGIEHAGKVIRSGKSFDENLEAAKTELQTPEAIADIKESGRQAAVGGGAGRAVTIAAGGERAMNIPKDDLGKFSLDILVPDQSKHGERTRPMSRVVQQDPSKSDSPITQPATDVLIKDEKGNVSTVKMQLVDVGLVDEKTGAQEFIEQTFDPTGLAPQFSFKGEVLKAGTLEEATAEVLAESNADRKVVYPVTGELFIQKVATNMDGTIDYATGLNDANTGHPVLVKENPNVDGPQFSAYEGGVVGNSVEEVAQKVQEIGTPKVTDAQGKRANEILEQEGVSKETLTRIYKDVFAYSPEQAKVQANAMMNKIDRQIDYVKRITTPTELENKKEGTKRKPTVLTPEQVFAEMATNKATKRAEGVKKVAEAFKAATATQPPVSAPPAAGAKPTTPAPASGKLGITPVDVAKTQTEKDPDVGPKTIEGKQVKNPELRDYPNGKKTKTGVHYNNIQGFIDDMGWSASAYKELFDYLKDKNVNFEFRFSKGRDVGGGKMSVGHYAPGTNTIVVHNKTPLRTLGHEAMHAVLYTSGAWKNTEFLAKMGDIRKSIKKAVKVPGFAEKHMKGFSKEEVEHYIDYTTNSGSVQEIVTHAFTHPEYANFLANIPASSTAKPGDTAWGRLKEIILEYVGKTLNLDSNALDELNAVLDEYAGVAVKAAPSKGEPVVETPPETKAEPAPVKEPEPKKEEPKKEEPKKKEPPKKEEPKSKGDAVQKRKTEKAPVGKTPRGGEEVGKKISPKGKEVADAGKEEKTGVESLPASQRSAVKKALGQKMKLVGVKKFGGKVHPVVEMKDKSGVPTFITYKGDVFFNLDDAVRRSLVEEKAPKKKKVPPVEKITGDTSKEQPAMKPATDRTKVEETPQPEPVEVKKVETPPVRKVTEQPSEDATATADMVVELLGQSYEFLPKNMPKQELIDFVAALDENGRPLGPAKAFAIVDQMSNLGYIKINGKKVDLLFSVEPSVVLGDPNADYRKASRDAADAAKAAAKTTIQGQADKDLIDSVRGFIADAPEGIRNDAGALAKEVAAAFGVTVDAAKGLINASVSAGELFKGFSFTQTVKDFISAISHGRAETLSAFSKGLGMQIGRLSTVKPSDFIHPLSYIRTAAAIVSTGVASVQAMGKMVGGNFDSEFFAPRFQKFADWSADRAKIGVTSNNAIVRRATLFMQGFYRGLAYTSSEIRTQGQLRGKRQEGALLAQQWMDELYSLIGRDQEALARIHAALDPEAYAKTQYKDVTYSSLNDAEKGVYSALRVNMDNLHNWSLKKGYISEETFLKFVNENGEINYFGRAYQQFFDESAMGEDVTNTANALRADFTIYKHRKDFEDIKDLDLERDPIYIAAQRMATALQNEAVTDYAESIYTNKKIPRFDSHEAWKKAGSPAGFSQLGKHGVGGVYGPLTGMYLPNYIVYDFKGFFFANKAMNHGYSFLKWYDRLWFRRGMKEVLTVYNPAVNIGNQTTNYTFAFANGIDAMNYNIGLNLAGKSIKDKDEIYRKLLAEGLLGTGIVSEFNKRQPVRIEEAAAQQKKDQKSFVKPIKAFAETAQSHYANIDDKAKIAAYWVKTHVYGMSHDQAIREVSQGFQNYDSVGMYFDIGSKMPIIGNAFAKFTGDLVRLVGSSAGFHPLSTASYVAFIYAMNELTSALSGEDDLDKEIRQGRPFQPKIPFIDLPLAWKIGKYEINMARLIAPFQVYDKGQGEAGLWSVLDFLPVRTFVASSGGKPAYLKFDDPMLGPIMSLLYDKDFRGISISDPKKIKGELGSTGLDVLTPEWRNKNRLMNRAEYYFRSFGFIPATVTDLYHIHTSGEDYYGRKKDWIDRTISTMIRVEEFNSVEARAAVMKELKSRTFELKGEVKKNNTSYWHFANEIEKVAAKDITPEQKVYQIEKLKEEFFETLGESGPRVRKIIDELYDPLNYKKAIMKKDSAQ